MQDFSTIITALSIAGGLALGVERIIEYLKHIMEVDTRGHQDKDQEEIRKRTDNLFKQTTAAINRIDDKNPLTIIESRKCEIKSIDELINTKPVVQHSEGEFADTEGDEKFPAPAIPVIEYHPRMSFEAARVVFYNLAAAGLGIILAGFFELHLMNLFFGLGLGIGVFVDYPQLDVILTGIVIGGGSQPIHVLIRFLSQRKIEGKKRAEQTELAKITGKALASETVKEQVLEPVWKDIIYKGGIKPLSMDRSHIRTNNPNLIVYHHTAMSDKKTFQNIVDEFLVTKNWLTGYHCVVMPDGAIKPFCRWDRYGNHAKGKNMRSLGVSFHGNFETKARDKFSNADGRYGSQQPTETQLHAGARVVALWTYLYDDIELDFDKCIRPHRDVMPKGYTVCPGSNFPVKEFQRLIQYYYEAWGDSELAQQKITEFKEKEYIYA